MACEDCVCVTGSLHVQPDQNSACKGRQLSAKTMSAPQDPSVNCKGFRVDQTVDQNRLLVSNLTYVKCLESLDVMSQMTPVTGATRSRVRQNFLKNLHLLKS